MIKEITPNLYVIYPKFFSSNIYVLKGKKITLIDTGSAANKPQLKKCLREIKIEPEQVELILLTHAHTDHISGCDLFKNAEIWMSKHDAKFVNKKDSKFTASDLFSDYHYPKIKNFYKKNQKFDLEKFELEIIETPGHTEGGICIYDKKNKLLFTGDTLFKGTYGRYDLLSGNKEKLKKSLKKLKELDFEYLLPGHEKILKGDQKANIDKCLSKF